MRKNRNKIRKNSAKKQTQNQSIFQAQIRHKMIVKIKEKNGKTQKKRKRKTSMEKIGETVDIKPKKVYFAEKEFLKKR